MKNKKHIGLIAVLLAAVMALFVGCGQVNTPSTTNNKPTILLRSEAQHSMLVGSKITLMYSVYNTKSEVVFSSDNTNVVTVDKFASVTAVGAGNATVTIALADDPTVKAEVKFTVTRNNFMTSNGLYAGEIRFGEQATGGAVTINGGQAQLLANAKGQKWYFKTHIDHNGVVGGDDGGMWGVGSFLVDAAHPIGNNMFWFIMRKSGANSVNVWYGGWRYANEVKDTHKEILVSDGYYDITRGVDITMIRVGITHYMVVEFVDGEGNVSTVKCMYDVPFFDESDTYPGVFSQNQRLSVSNYSMSNDAAAVDAELAKFQLAEQVQINGLSDTLYPGEYMLNSTVLPTYTVDKSVTYAIKEATDGVTVGRDGALNITDAAIGKTFTVVATAKSNEQTTAERTYSVEQKAQSTSELFDSTSVIAVKSPEGRKARSVNIESETAVTVTDRTTDGESGDAYIRVNAASEKWYIKATVQNRTSLSSIAGTEIGIMSVTNGYMDYVKYGIQYALGGGDVIFAEQNGEPTVFEDSASSSSTNSKNTLGLIRDGDIYYIEINGKFAKKFTVSGMADTSPALYALGTGVYFTNIALVTDGDEIDAYVAAKKYYVGSRVVTDGTDFILQPIDLGAPYGSATNDTLDWPPDNDYCNGIKSTTSFTGDFAIEFTMSDITPVDLSGVYDAKILVYLKSERVTSSLQFEIKRDSAALPTTVKFLANLDDATWTTYEMPAGVDILSGETKVKIVKTSDCVELYLNDVRVYEGESFMQNTGYWGSATVCTPGIGSFLCGVKISDPTFTAVE